MKFLLFHSIYEIQAHSHHLTYKNNLNFLFSVNIFIYIYIYMSFVSQYVDIFLSSSALFSFTYLHTHTHTDTHTHTHTHTQTYTKWFWTWTNVAFQEIFCNISRYFWLSQLGCLTSISYVKARNAAKYPIIQRTVPTPQKSHNKKSLGQISIGSILRNCI